MAFDRRGRRGRDGEKGGGDRGFRRRREEPARAEWIPRTELGKKVLAGEYSTLESVFNSGRKILEPQIIDFLLKGQLTEEVMEVTSTQRMTACGRKMAMRAVVLVGNHSGYVGVGMGKAPESRDAINEAVLDAKKNIIRVRLGCGSWECGCGQPHTVAREVHGNNGSTHIWIKPAPRGVGIVAGETSKKVLELAGVHDAWSFAKGRTRNVLNMILATISALDSLNNLKKGTDAQSEESEAAETGAEGDAEGGAAGAGAPQSSVSDALQSPASGKSGEESGEENGANGANGAGAA
ncbi:MAG: 30S ribosomal protein S5 [Candidatus Micrarchaeota archaeon]